MATVEIQVPDDFDVECLDAPPGQIKVRPVFYGRGKESDPCLIFHIRGEDGSVIGRYLLCVNGRNLTLELKDRSRPVMALIDKLHLAKKAETAADAQAV
ncbi:MAG: hypothetical protein M5U26_13235 [Planctomycetota bacterium]|nr:hypothetical protein [Planctomycetota bacterium]